MVPIMYEWKKVKTVQGNKIAITIYSWTVCRGTFFFPETKNLNFGDKQLLGNRGYLKFESLEACKGKKATFG